MESLSNTSSQAHCTSPNERLSGQAAGFLYLMMSENFDLQGNGFTRMKIQLTIALSQLASKGKRFVFSIQIRPRFGFLSL